MSAKSWVLAAVGVVVVAVAVAGVVQWNARKQASNAARVLSASEAPAPATVAPVPPVAAPVVDYGLLEAEARDAAARSMREDTIAVQKRLREAETARREEVQAIKDGERCINGQKMKRVDNGWVQAGNC